MMSVNSELKILVLGDSHVYWLVAFFRDSVGPRACFTDFSVGGRVIHVMTHRCQHQRMKKRDRPDKKA